MEGNKKVQDVDHSFSLLSDQDIYLFNEGSNYRIYEKMGAHQASLNNIQGTKRSTAFCYRRF
jgi:1,4-alpha-glucan branching enzyme